MKYIIIAIAAFVLLNGCNSGDTVAPQNGNGTGSYNKISTIENGNVKFEVWSATGTSLFIGYNEIAFKVFIGGTEKNTGYVKYMPKMYHTGTGPWHSSPVSSSFNYNTEKSLFTGYVCFTMISDLDSYWFGNYDYNGEVSADSVLFNVIPLSTNQMTIWDDINSGHTYMLTLIEPKTATVGLNNFSCLLHQTDDDKYYTEVNGAEMYIRPWMESHGHGSSNNINPAGLGGGKYSGKANMTMVGGWDVYDSIRYNGNAITESPPVKFHFSVQ
ncbi:MAG: FixH family protein [Ignavibacteriae bacterium]|nr:FixH family protein [Ignavibacteriota bacterium]